jgi:starch phosphorylase
VAQNNEYGCEIEALRAAVGHHLTYSCVVSPEHATQGERLRALSLAVRDRAAEAMLATAARQERVGAKRLAYLSMEFLMGRSLENNLMNLGLLHAAREACGGEPVDLETLAALEPDAALGNGGLGRLAACFLDSLATLDLPGYGYGINYEFGMFQQHFVRGEQRERADPWAAMSSPWLVERPDLAVVIPVYGTVDHARGRDGEYNPMWMDWKVLIGVPHDLPVVGYGGRTVNTLRLFSARASSEFDVNSFNSGDYVRAVEEKIDVEKISKVLYPSDALASGKELRLLQEYFLVACALRDLFRSLSLRGAALEQLPDQLAVQLNDTHPALAVAELMRILVDEHSLAWDQAWSLTQRTLAYTNHTLMPEALEKWSVHLMERVLPRHMQIIFEINRRFMEFASTKFLGDITRLQNVSVIEESEPKQVRMAHLSIIGSHSVNGVAALHSELVKTQLVPDFYALWPERFNNKTNGVTPRRWLRLANPDLSALIDQSIGDGWTADLEQLRGLESFAEDSVFRAALSAVKRRNKLRLCSLVAELTRVTVDPDSLFDVQIKRIHEYKRQLLNLLHIVHCYLRVVEDQRGMQPRTFIFGGKAAPGYVMAKQIIRLIHDVGAVVNGSKRARELMRVVYLPDYRVSLAEKIIPAADLSEQISTAGKEASGTGNMKFAMNGALTIGTLDGANVEIREQVGPENIYVFGLAADQIEGMRREQLYQPEQVYRESAPVRRVLDAIGSGMFSSGERNRHRDVLNSLLHCDEYFLLADFASYVEAQERVSTEYEYRSLWGRKATLNIARMGQFSSDRTIREYAEQIWNLRPVR